MFEAQLLGSFRKKEDPRFREAWRSRSGAEQGYLSYRDAISLVREFTDPAEATHPEKDFLRDLRIELKDRLGERLPEETVRAYNAIGTPLDMYHGIDAFLSINFLGKEYIITLDATLREEKLSGDEVVKADLVIGSLPDPAVDTDRYLAEISVLANRIAKIIQEREKQNMPFSAAAAA